MIRPSYTRQEIERLAEQFPNLCASGFRDEPRAGDTPLTDEDIVNQISICAWFIGKMCTPTKTFRRLRTSYGWKHVVENALGLYVCNGAFIAAMILAGYRVERCVRRSPNAVFNIHVSSDMLRAYINDRKMSVPISWES
jgi:hypothetical protein